LKLSSESSHGPALAAEQAQSRLKLVFGRVSASSLGLNIPLALFLTICNGRRATLICSPPVDQADVQPLLVIGAYRQRSRFRPIR